MFSSTSFQFYLFTLRSLIHFNFCIWYEGASNFILLHVGMHLPQHHLLKRPFLSPLIFLGILVENQSTIHERAYFWTLNSVPLVHVSTIMLVAQYLDYKFVLTLEIKCESSIFFFFFKMCICVCVVVVGGLFWILYISI